MLELLLVEELEVEPLLVEELEVELLPDEELESELPEAGFWLASSSMGLLRLPQPVKIHKAATIRLMVTHLK